MKCLCITGADRQDVDLVASILQQAGMKTALAAKHGEPVDIGYWHEQVLAQVADAESEADEQFSPANPGRLWEQLASEIFLANLKSKIWGWADTRSIAMLDFWLDFEPNLNFVLVVTPLEQSLAAAIAAGLAMSDAETLMEDWHLQHQQMLRFHLRNPKRSLLLAAGDCAANPALLTERCARQWKLPLLLPNYVASSNTSPGPLAQYLARQLANGFPQYAGLQHELDASLTHLGPAPQSVMGASVPDFAQLIADYQLLRDRSEEQKQLQTLQQETTAKINLLEISRDYQGDQVKLRQIEIAQLSNARDEQSILASQRQSVIDSLKAELDEKTRESAEYSQQLKALQELESKLKEAGEENELLLLQLHQVQEELEAIFLKQEATQKQITALTQTKATFEKEKPELLKRAEELQKQVTALTQTKAAFEKEKPELVKRAEELQKQVTALTQTRATFEKEKPELLKRADELQKQVAALTQAKAVLEKEKPELVKRADELQKQVTTLTQAKATLEKEKTTLSAQLKTATDSKPKIEARIKEAEQENELLLLQLHQVQEELEHYFLQHQQIQQKLKVADERWQHMLQRNTGYCDFAGLELLATEAGEASKATWKLTGLNAAGRSVQELQFTTFLHSGHAGIILERKPGTTGPFVRWPVVAAGQNTLAIVAAGPRAQVEQSLEALRDLAAADMALLQTLVHLLDEALANPASLKLPAGFTPAPLQAGLQLLAHALKNIPTPLRYDQVSLKREQVNPDYEHLWLLFTNLSFDNQNWPSFEFRLSCAHVSPKVFGRFPKLEFPEEGGKAPFAAWFVESQDDFGDKFELRFSLPDGMDLTAWAKLSGHDHEFLQALASRMPAMLTGLQGAGVKLKRPWSDWLQMMADIQRILFKHIEQPSVQPITQPAVQPGQLLAEKIPFKKKSPVPLPGKPSSKKSVQKSGKVKK